MEKKIYKPFFTNWFQVLKGITFSIAVLSMVMVSAQVTLEKEIKISNSGLYFDGAQTSKNAPNNGTGKYDFIFGSRITPHGDCIKEYNGYVFMTWYRGGKLDRHVMLSRYNTRTGVLKTIEFPHQHGGFQNQWWLGESHNTIAIGVCPIDGTIHMLYDMHSYDENRPSDGSLKNDYFRYTYSKKNAATVPDSEFNINQFVKDSDGDYKHIDMKSGVDYRSLTYPNFFLNKKGELFMWIREGGNNNGAYKFCKYDGNSWSDFKQFNIMNAKSRSGVNYNWGLYGDIKFSGGKMRIGFSTRYSNNNDIYKYNNGFHYAYSDDPNGLNQWKDHAGKSVSLPVINPDIIKISEPGNQVPSSGANSVTMSSGSDWITTDNDDIHFVTRVNGSDGKWVNVHTYKKAGESSFKTATNFPGGNLYAYKNDVYLIGLAGGRVFVEKAPGGTNNWTRIFQAPSGTKNFRHGNVYIDNGKLYFYLMESKSGNAQPIYLQIYDMGLGNVNQAPTVSISSPLNNATFEVGEKITLDALADDPDGSVKNVNFKINNDYYEYIDIAPYKTTFTPTEPGTYTIGARAFDNNDDATEVSVTITVLEENKVPVASFSTPIFNSLEEGYSELYVNVDASDPNNDELSVMLKIDGKEIRSESVPPFEWGHEGSPDQNETVGLAVGDHVFDAVVTDSRGASTTISKTITVTKKIVLPVLEITSPTASQVFLLSDEINLNATATDGDGSIAKVVFLVNGTFYSQDSDAPYEGIFIPLEEGVYTLGAKAIDNDGNESEKTVSVEVKLVTSGKSTLKSEQLTVYPNPSHTGVFELSGESEWQVYNLSGINILSGISNLVDLSLEPQGVYFLKADGKVIQLLHH